MTARLGRLWAWMRKPQYSYLALVGYALLGGVIWGLILR